jgi:hypothetical protein
VQERVQAMVLAPLPRVLSQMTAVASDTGKKESRSTNALSNTLTHDLSSRSQAVQQRGSKSHSCSDQSFPAEGPSHR